MDHQQWFSKTATDKFGRPLRTRGTLLKKGGSTRASMISSGLQQRRPSLTSGRRNWQPRWFSLDLDRGELRYYEDSSMSLQKGLVLLTPESQLQFETPNLRGKHAKEADELYYFEVTKTRDEKGALRDLPFQLRANSAAEHEQWCNSIEFSLALIREAAGQISIDDLDNTHQANSKKVPANKPAYVAELAQTLQRRRDSDLELQQPAPTPRVLPHAPPTNIPSPNNNTKKSHLLIPPPPSHPPPENIPPPPPGPPPPQQFIL